MLPGPEDALVVDQMLKQLARAGFLVTIEVEVGRAIDYIVHGDVNEGPQMRASALSSAPTMLAAVREVHDLLVVRGLEMLRETAQGQTDVRGNRHGADASQPGPAHPPGDSRHLEGAT